MKLIFDPSSELEAIFPIGIWEQPWVSASLRSLFVLSESPEILHQRPHGGPWDGNNPNNMNTNVSVSIFDFSLQITNSRALAHTYYNYILYSKMSWKTTFQFVFSIYPSSKRNINDLFTISHNITAGSQHSSLPWQVGSLSPLRVLFFLGDT